MRQIRTDEKIAIGLEAVGAKANSLPTKTPKEMKAAIKAHSRAYEEHSLAEQASADDEKLTAFHNREKYRHHEKAYRLEKKLNSLGER